MPDLVTAGLPTVAVRMPRHPLALDLIERTGLPIAAPSANPFGYVSPTTAEHVRRHLGSRVDLVLDGGPCTVGLESTVLSLAGAHPAILRAGGIAREDIEQVIGDTRRDGLPLPVVSPRRGKPQATTPAKPRAWWAPDAMNGSAGARAGLLRFGRHGATAGFAAVEDLSPEGDVREAAINLFAALHRLDALGLDVIVADPVPESGLGVAVMDRLRRAARRHRRRAVDLQRL